VIRPAFEANWKKHGLTGEGLQYSSSNVDGGYQGCLRKSSVLTPFRCFIMVTLVTT
jgi:hypothetical protein